MEEKIKGFQEAQAQTWEELVASVVANSGYKAEIVDGRESFISLDGRRIFTERIKSKEDPRLRAFYDLTVEAYGDQEATGLDWLRESFGPGRPDRYFCAVDQSGKMIAGVHAEFLAAADKSLVYLCYALPDKNSPETLALLSKVYAEAAKENPGKKMLVSIEADGDMKGQCNKAGLRRLYYQDDKGQLVEVQYRAPAIAFNEATGEGVFEQIPNHLMVWNSQKKMVAEELLAVVAAMHEQFVKYDEFVSKEARARAAESTRRLLEALKTEIAGHELVLLGSEERQKLIAEGKQVIDWAEGD